MFLSNLKIFLIIQGFEDTINKGNTKDKQKDILKRNEMNLIKNLNLGELI